jgi:hypothetical protein
MFQDFENNIIWIGFIILALVAHTGSGHDPPSKDIIRPVDKLNQLFNIDTSDRRLDVLERLVLRLTVQVQTMEENRMADVKRIEKLESVSNFSLSS